MSWIGRLARRFRLLARLDAAERSMHDEMRAHLEHEIADRVARGATERHARASALRDFGPLEAWKEAGRDARGTRGVEDFARDLRHAARVLVRHRAFALSAVLTLALGIGTATAIFSVVYGVLLRPLPYKHPDRLVALWEHNVARATDRNVVAVTNFEAWRERATSFEDMAALVPAPVTLPAPEGPERVIGGEVSPSLFRLLGVRPMLGRDFNPDEGAAAGVVILSEQYWRTRLGADPAIVGKTLQIEGRPHSDGRPHEVIGVMPAGFEPPAYHWLGRQALWVPFVPGPENRWYGRYLLVVARLKPGVSIDSARAELAGIASVREKEDASNEGWSANVTTLASEITGEVRDGFLYILGTAALLLLLAVTNVSTLLAAHTRRRLHELGLRRALGATDGRLRRQLLTESILLGALGCAAGVALAYPLADVLVARIPPEVPRVSGISVNATVLAASAAVSALAALLVGALAARSVRQAPSALLRDGSLRVSAPSAGRALVVIEVALGLVVAVFAGLVVRTFISLKEVDLGFQTRGVVVGRVAIGTEYETGAAKAAFFDELLARIRSVPGVEQAGMMSGTPIRGIGPATSVRDVRAAATSTDPIADGRWADTEALRALDVPLLAGTLFDGSDRLDGPVRIVITQAMARALWPGQDPIGRVAHLDMFDGLEATVIGVVGDVHFAGARTAPRPAFFLAPARFASEAYDIVVRSDREPAVVIGAMRAALRSLDPRTPLHRIQTLDDMVATALARDRFIATLLSAFAALALALASVGIYGVFASDVAARRKEIGIRMALGARRGHVVGEIVGAGAMRACAGIVAGAVVAGVLARSMRSLLFGVDTIDAWSFGTAAACLLAVTLAATLIPALHAARVSPLTALRE